MLCNILIFVNSLCLASLLVFCFVFRDQLSTAISVATRLASNYSRKTGKESVHSLLLKDMNNLGESPPPNEYENGAKAMERVSTNSRRVGISLKRKKTKSNNVQLSSPKGSTVESIE